MFILYIFVGVWLIGLFFVFFFFNDTATTEIYTLSLHDALPSSARWPPAWRRSRGRTAVSPRRSATCRGPRSEEHTSELQSQSNLVCRLLLEKKKKKKKRLNIKNKKTKKEQK